MGNYYQSDSTSFRFGERLTWAVQRLILVSIGVFAGQLIWHIPFGAGVNGVGLDLPGRLFSFETGYFFSGQIWRPVSYIFLHGSLMHLFGNMVALYFFGPEVERALGTRQFIYFYLLCGAIGVMATVLPVPLLGSGGFVIGASGAVMGVLVAFAMLNPEREIFFFPLPIPINARAMVIIFIVINVMSAIGNPGANSSVGTHLGGIAVGYLYMKWKPMLRRASMHNRAQRKEKDPIGDAIDNIFKFDEKKRRDRK